MKIKFAGQESCRPEVNEKNGLVYLTWPMLSKIPGFLHGFSTRLGGVSRDYLGTMNLSYSRGDDPENVTENYRRIAAAIGFQPEDIVCSDQTHTTNVRRVCKKDCGSGITRPKDFKDVDGMITNEPDVVLATFYADCVPLFFIDPEHGAIGLSHSGWRGTKGRMGEATVKRMTEEFGTDPKKLYAAIGPSICQDCYEVSEDVILEFQQAFQKEQWDKLYYKKPNGKYQLNLWEANRIILLEAGIPENQISLPGICTCCNPDFLFSHRKSHGKRGNLGAFLMVKQPCDCQKREAAEHEDLPGFPALT